MRKTGYTNRFKNLDDIRDCFKCLAWIAFILLVAVLSIIVLPY